ncbi:cell wall-active antibiotics response protein LiaF, partial [Microbacteriaceae bacterium K1510]|nr:cell wall-active antibiotics response protein LiaF [Microbacteriaceae bacterium K1510]
FIGDIHLGHDYWDLVPLNISHFIGDTVIDLTRANIAPGETRITVSSFIGDVKVFLPTDSDIGIQVVSSAFIGDSKVLGRKEGGMFRHMD